MSNDVAAKLPRGDLSRLARELSVTPGHVRRILIGERRPSLTTAQKLADLGHPVWALYPDLKQEDGDAA